MTDITPKEAREIISHYTDIGYGIVIEGEDTSKIKQALSLACKTLANGTPYNPSGDLVSRDAVKKYARKVMYEKNATNFSLLKMFDEIIDNAPPLPKRLEGKCCGSCYLCDVGDCSADMRE